MLTVCFNMWGFALLRNRWSAWRVVIVQVWSPLYVLLNARGPTDLLKESGQSYWCLHFSLSWPHTFLFLDLFGVAALVSKVFSLPVHLADFVSVIYCHMTNQSEMCWPKTWLIHVAQDSVDWRFWLGSQLEDSGLSWARWWPRWALTSHRWPQLDSSSFDKCGLFPFNRLNLVLFMSAWHVPREWPEACRVSWGSELAPHHCFCYKGYMLNMKSWKLTLPRGRDPERGKIETVSSILCR